MNDGVRAMKFVFRGSSDFFGRITIYDLRVEGLVRNIPEGSGVIAT